MKLRINSNLIAVASLLLILVGIYYLLNKINTPSQYTDLHTLDDGWTVSLNGKKLGEDQSLKTINIPVINTNDKLILTRVLPNLDTYDAPCLYFYSRHSIVDVYLVTETQTETPQINNQVELTTGSKTNLIYMYGRDLQGKTTEAPNKYNNVSLSGPKEILNNYSLKENGTKEKITKKTLTVVFTATGDAAFSSVSPFILGSRVNVLKYHLINNSIHLFAGVFLVVLGFILIIISPYMFFYHNKEARLFFSGFISLLLGTFILAQYDLIDMLINNPLVDSFCEYASLTCIPIAILGYFASIFRGRIRSFLNFLMLLDILLFSGMTLLHTLLIMRFSKMTSFIQGYIISETVLVLGILIVNRKQFKESENRNLNSDLFFLIGAMTFMIFSITDIVTYDMQKYSNNRGYFKGYGNGFTFGSVIFVSCMLISYMFYSIYSSNITSLQQRMADLAYTDPLTGLSNRARCEQIMDIISHDKSVYSIISIDLNKLKKVNDTYGHHEGDRLITGFATILTECFWDANLIGRMGGDEFIVILLGDHANSCTKRLHELYSILSDWNRKEQVFQYSASYGYAYSYEVPNSSASEVYMLADSRMYEMKKEHHGRKEMEVKADA